MHIVLWKKTLNTRVTVIHQKEQVAYSRASDTVHFVPHPWRDKGARLRDRKLPPLCSVFRNLSRRETTRVRVMRGLPPNYSGRGFHEAEADAAADHPSGWTAFPIPASARLFFTF